MPSSAFNVLVHELAGWVQRLPPPQPRMAALAASLRKEFGGRDEPVTAAGVATVEAVAHQYCRHLELHFHPAGELVVDRAAPGWPDEDAAAVSRSGAPISSVRR